ncbi:MAG TPA: HPr family phosphocarrier protein [Gemmatimonadota bacterium]|nr:HPr family phosphocarrier protein [Gemmatimonadota bacterium]
MTGEDYERDEAREVRIPNELGLHARPAAAFVKLSSRYECEIYIAKGDLEVNGKSIMGVMMLAAECGSTVRIRAEGPDAAEAVEALAALVESGFGETTPT